MPLFNSKRYRPPFWIFNGHLETMLPHLYRKIKVPYQRERVDTPDGDFLDFDWIKKGNRRLMILCHGLEGSAQSQYIKGLASASIKNQWDVLAINWRSCSGEVNRKLRMYHHGEIRDLTWSLERLMEASKYEAYFLSGFSLGGNIILKYLGVLGGTVSSKIKGAFCVSVPCDLASSSVALDAWYNYLYTRRFRRSLKKKLTQKDQQFPGILDMEKYDKTKTWWDFDNTYTAVIYNFADANEYYHQGSANNYLEGIKIPVLLLNALNDPFLREASYPYSVAKNHAKLFLETPKYGGHVGFWYPGIAHTFAENRVFEFIEFIQ